MLLPLLDLHFVAELEDKRGAAVVLHDFRLSAMPADAGERHAGDADFEQCALDGLQPFGPDHAGDELHWSLMKADKRSTRRHAWRSKGATVTGFEYCTKCTKHSTISLVCTLKGLYPM